MKKLVWGLALLVVAACGAAEPGPARDVPPLVSSAWLAKNRDAVVLVDMQSERADYEKGHLPGAVHVTVDELRTDKKLLLPVDALAKELGALGIDADAHVVVYDEKRGRNATWMWFALTQLGHTMVSLLDEPFAELEKTFVTDVPSVDAKTYRARRSPRDIVEADWVKARVGETVMLDARPEGQYTGEKPKKGMRGGHIEGARNVPYTSFFGPDGRALPVDAARAKLTALVGRELAPDTEIVVYCNSYHEGSNVHFHLARLGFTNVKAFDGSMKVWEGNDWPTKKGTTP